jgi:hypothetical protein
MCRAISGCGQYMQRPLVVWTLPFSDAPTLLMPTFRTSVRDYRNGIAMWRGNISISVWVFPAIHHPDGLLIGFCAANLTFRNKHKMLSRAKRSPTPMVRRARLSESCVCLSISTDGRDSRRVSDYRRIIRTAQTISGRFGLHIPGSCHWSEVPVRLGCGYGLVVQDLCGREKTV